METFKNPVAPKAADPWVIQDGDRYLYCYSIGTGVAVTSCEKLTEICRDQDAVCYRAPEDGPYSKEYWAPELHKIGGQWYIYVAADDGNNDNHRMYCLRAMTDDPTGQYEMVGKISDESDKWAIDGTVLQYKGEYYFIWSGWEGDVNVAQNLYIAHMSDPATIDSPRVLLSTPEYEWEKRSCTGGLPTINEGPAILSRDGRVVLVYSASGSWSDDYCLGMLTLEGDDPLNPDCWEKHPEPIFEKTSYAFGPGHCSFTTSPDGSEDWVVYHANQVSGSGWGGRNLWMQRVHWSEGLPILGRPTAPDEALLLPSDGYRLPHGRMQPSAMITAVAAFAIFAAALLLVVLGAILQRGGSAWFLPLIALPLIAECVILWQKNMDWLGKFLLTNDGILCESPLNAPILLKWEEIVDCCYLPAKKDGKGLYCFSTEPLTLQTRKGLSYASQSAKLVKITDREGLSDALAERLPASLLQKLDVDRIASN